jgi:chromosome segregation ATPase
MKKFAIRALVIVGVLVLLNHVAPANPISRGVNKVCGKVMSYASTLWAKVTAGVKDQVPLEFEIDRLRHEIAKIDDDMSGYLSPIAEEMATVKELKQRVQLTRENLRKEKVSLLAMAKDLESGTQTITYGDEEFSAEEVQAKLDRDFASYQRSESELKSLQKLLAAKEKSLRTTRAQLANLKSLKRDLEVKLAQLEAEVKTVRLAQTKDNYQLDDSRLADIKASLAEIEHRLNVEKAEVELHGQIATDPIPVHKKPKSAADLSKTVKKYFGEKHSNANERVAVKQR